MIKERTKRLVVRTVGSLGLAMCALGLSYSWPDSETIMNEREHVRLLRVMLMVCIVNALSISVVSFLISKEDGSRDGD